MSAYDRVTSRSDFYVVAMNSLRKYIVFLFAFNLFLILIGVYLYLTKGGENYYVTRPQGQIIQIDSK